MPSKKPVRSDGGALVILYGDCRQVLPTLPESSVQCCVTSPPYFGLRDYGHPGQIGLEQTPDEYVAQMVAVFREVRRVLRDDGTLWLNLGDSYGAAGGDIFTGFNERYSGTGVDGKQTRMGDSAKAAGAVERQTGLRPKNLLGIPWRVAFALQQPYYDGRVKREIDRVWLAAMIDGEGCFYVHKRCAGQHAGDGYTRKTDTYSPAFEVANTHKAIVDRCAEIAGVGSVICQEKDRRQPLWRWTVRSDEARSLAREIYPYLVGKQQQCRIVCGMPSNGEKAEAAWQAMKLLHAGSETTVDFQTPETCFQPGYYLRQDLIWAKPNPMPESVTDRCTKAHEYIFLLSKSASYFYDAESIKEAASEDSGFAKQRAKGVNTWKYNDTPERLAQTGQRVEASTFGEYGKRNRRSVWTVATQPYSGAHFAVFPPALIEPCILAGCPSGGTVLDPFFGSGTTGEVCNRLGRKWIGIELNEDYAPLQKQRTSQSGLAF